MENLVRTPFPEHLARTPFLNQVIAVTLHPLSYSQLYSGNSPGSSSGPFLLGVLVSSIYFEPQTLVLDVLQGLNVRTFKASISAITYHIGHIK